VLCAAIDIHKQVFQAAVLDAESGEVVKKRFPADRAALGEWAVRWRGASVRSRSRRRPGGAGSGAQAFGFDVRLAEPVQARALRGRRRGAKTDRLDARWLAELPARQLRPESWITTEEIRDPVGTVRRREAARRGRRARPA
jgi:hypothetical protein